MEHISDALKTASLTVKNEEKKEKSYLDPHTVEVVNSLFTFFFAICRGFEKQYQDSKRLTLEKTQWIKAFQDKGINSLEKIKHGIKKCRLETPINTPTIGDFLKWCTISPKDLGFPDLNAAFYISNQMNRQFSDYKYPDPKVDTVIRHAISQIGSSTYREMHLDKARKLFDSYYEISLNQYMEGKLEIIDKMLEDNSHQIRELSKQDNVVMEQYKHISGVYALEAMKNILS